MWHVSITFLPPDVKNMFFPVFHNVKNVRSRAKLFVAFRVRMAEWSKAADLKLLAPISVILTDAQVQTLLLTFLWSRGINTSFLFASF